MARISSFYGVAISMYVGREHPPPHFHAIYGEHEAQVAFDGTALRSLPRRAASLVAEWASAHAAELEANWSRATTHESLVSLGPLP